MTVCIIFKEWPLSGQHSSCIHLPIFQLILQKKETKRESRFEWSSSYKIQALYFIWTQWHSHFFRIFTLKKPEYWKWSFTWQTVRDNFLCKQKCKSIYQSHAVMQLCFHCRDWSQGTDLWQKANQSQAHYSTKLLLSWASQTIRISPCNRGYMKEGRIKNTKVKIQVVWSLLWSCTTI